MRRWRIGWAALACMTLALAAVAGGLLAGCTPEQRSDCVVCNVTGLCALLGDDPNLAMRKHPAWFVVRP